MNRVKGDVALETYIVLKLTCGHHVYLDMFSGPETGAEFHTGEELVYCSICGADAQIASLIDLERTIQVVTEWKLTPNRVARDHNPRHEALRLRQADDPPTGESKQPDSLRHTRVPGGEVPVDSPKGTKAGGSASGTNESGDVLASPAGQ